MGRKMSQKQKTRQTRGWLEQNADSREWVLKVVEGDSEAELEALPPTPLPHFFPALWENEEAGGGGTKVLGVAF